MSCMDAGYTVWDGVPRACGNCSTGREWEQNGGKRKTAVRAELDPRTLPPGGDVMITEMKRSAAGLPPGVIGADVVIQASLAEIPMLHDLVRALDDLTRDVPGAAERAVQVLGGLPAWAIPEDVANREDPEDSAGDVRTEGEQESLVPPMPGDKRSRKQRQPAGAPLEPPGE